MLTPSLARALRKSALIRYRQLAETYDDTLCALLRAAYRGKWTSKRANAFWKELHRTAGRHCFGAFQLGSNAFHFAPRIADERLSVQTLCIEVPSRHLPQVYDATAPVELGPHAVERLFLRLNTVDAGAVQEEIMQAMLYAYGMREAARRLGLRQLSLPTAHGSFLCEVEEGEPLFARTWLRRNDATRGTQTTAPKWDRINKALLRAFGEWYRAVPAEDAAERLRSAAIGLMPPVEELATALAHV